MSCSPDSRELATTRRRLIALLSSLPLAGCGSSDAGDQVSGVSFSMVMDALSVATGLKAPPMVSREEAAAAPYASIGYRVGASSQGMLVLATQTGRTFLWTASSRVVIVTEGARITKTAGFPRNLGGTTFQGVDPVQDFSHPLPTAPISRLLDFPDLSRFAVQTISTFAVSGTETIAILGQQLGTLLVQEDCDCEEFDWQFQNKYWVDRETAFVWRSQQVVHPKLAPLQIDVFRPPG